MPAATDPIKEDRERVANRMACEICRTPGLEPFTAESIEPARQGTRWLVLPVAPESVRQARRFILDVLEEADADQGHVDDVVLVVSELITNAVREVARIAGKSVRLGVVAGLRWTHLYAVDSAPTMPDHTDRGLLAGSGRGIPIITALAAMTWIERHEQNKIVHVVLTRTGMTLTPDERRILRSVDR